ncbi:MAG: dihydroorotate dehydrogenase-like protein [Candidatus Dormibacteraeota bacterium]|nr:dihydroorotate dehydrogenase-like protein [Candidatus Dormibacteraeota bacterium]
MDLTATYLGLQLRNPLIASPSPLSRTVAGVRRLTEAGVGAVVLPSLFEEDILEAERREGMLLDQGADVFPEALSYFPETVAPASSPEAYLRLIERAARAVEVPVLASLNAANAEGWAGLARAMGEAGAAAIELNFYQLPADPEVTSADVEDRLLEALQAARAAARVPVAVKLVPYFSSLGEMATRLDRAGADGLILFNRWLQPEIDFETGRALPGIGLSVPMDGRLPRVWIALLRGRVRASLAGSSGVESAQDLVRYLLAGADAVMTTSALLRHGPDHARSLLEGLQGWMAGHGLERMQDFRARAATPGRPAELRSTYVEALRLANSQDRGPW